MAHYVALTCEALIRSIYALAAETPNTVSVRLYRQGLHNAPRTLRQTLQATIDEIEEGECDAILLAYGLCGGATANLTARHTPLVMPRAHDCIALYLGSNQRYMEEFNRHPGTYWYSVDYLERQRPGESVGLGAAEIDQTPEQYSEWVEKYGQEAADDLVEEMRRWKQHYTRAAFIDTGLGDAEPYEAKARAKADAEGWEFERLTGNRRLLHSLVNGQWESDEFLVVPPGHTIRQSGDESIVETIPAD